MASKKTPRAELVVPDFGFRRSWEFLRRRWKTVGLCTLFAWVLGIAYCFVGGQWYESRGDLFLMQKDPSLTSGAPGKTAGAESDVSEDLLATHMQLIHSESIVRNALGRFVPQKRLAELQSRQQLVESQTSTNLRLAVARLFASKIRLPEEEPQQEKLFISPESLLRSTGSQAGTTDAEDAVLEAPATVSATPDGQSADPEAELAPGDASAADSIADLIELRSFPVLQENLDVNERPVDYVMKNLRVTRGNAGQERDSRVLSISFRHSDAVEARLVCMAVIEAYQEFISKKFRSVGDEAVHLIQKATSDLADELRTAESTYKHFRERSPLILNGTESQNIHRIRYAQAQNDLISVQLSLAETSSRIRLVERQLAELRQRGAPPFDRLAVIDEKSVARIGILLTVQQGGSQSPLFQALQPERLELARAKLTAYTKLKADESTMALTMGPDHPEMQRVREEMRIIKQAIDDSADRTQLTSETDSLDPATVVDTYVRILKNDLIAQETREQELQEMCATEEEAAKGLITFELEDERLGAEVRRAQALYETVATRLGELNLATDYSGFINEMVRTPENGIEYWPSVPIILFLSTALGGIGGLGLALALEYRDRSFRDPDDVRHYLNAPLLTHIPNLTVPAGASRQFQSTINPTILAFHKPGSREAEVFRGLRTSLLFMPQENKCPIVAFASPNKGDGKSTVVANLAVSFAQAGRKVLLIDCDMRRPSVHALFGLAQEKGLSDILSGAATPTESVVAIPDIPNLKVLPAGSRRRNPSELLMSEAFKKLLAGARVQFDMVLLDCPPVLAVADPCVIGPLSDGVVVVIRLARDTKPQALRAHQMLAQVGTKTLGVVVNFAQDVSKVAYGKYSEASIAADYSYNSDKRNHDYYTETSPEEEVLS